MLALAALPAAFWAGRASTPAPRAPEAQSEAEPSRGGADSSAEHSALAAITSTVGLCPCPPPRRARAVGAALPRRAVPPIETPAAPRPDPTAETARDLKKHAADSARCAPSTAPDLRVHLEITVAPSGRVQRVDLKNLDPVPPEVARCLVDRMSGLTLPSFDATEPETFALTVVL